MSYLCVTYDCSFYKHPKQYQSLTSIDPRTVYSYTELWPWPEQPGPSDDALPFSTIGGGQGPLKNSIHNFTSPSRLKITKGSNHTTVTSLSVSKRMPCEVGYAVRRPRSHYDTPCGSKGVTDAAGCTLKIIKGLPHA